MKMLTCPFSLIGMYIATLLCIAASIVGSCRYFFTASGSVNAEMRAGWPLMRERRIAFSLHVIQPTNSLAASMFFDAAPTESAQPPSSTASGVGDQPRSEATTDFAGSSSVEKPPPHMKPCAEAPTAQALTISGKSHVRLP